MVSSSSIAVLNYSIGTVVSMILNVILLRALIAFRSVYFRPYAIMLSINALLDICDAVLFFIVKPVWVVGSGFYIVEGQGEIVRSMSQQDGLYLIALCIWIAFMSGFYLPIMYIYRASRLARKKALGRVEKVVAASLLFGSTSFLVITVLTECVPYGQMRVDMLQAVATSEFADLTATTHVFIGVSIYGIPFVHVLLSIMVPTMIEYAIVILCAVYLLRSMDVQSAISGKTIQMHQLLKKTLVAQACSPFIFFALPCAAMLVFPLNLPPPFRQLAVGTHMLLPWLGVSNACTTLYFMRPIRRIALRQLRAVVFPNTEQHEETIWVSSVSGSSHRKRRTNSINENVSAKTKSSRVQPFGRV